MATTNTRQSKRTPIALKIKFKSATFEQFIERYAVDVSHGGIFIRHKDPLPVGTTMRFEFQLKDASPLIVGQGTVVWIREHNPNQRGVAPGMGVRFDRLTEDSQVVLEQILAQKASMLSNSKEQSFSEVPTRVAPAPLVEDLAKESKLRLGSDRAALDNRRRGAPSPQPPIPFHSDADQFPEEAFEQATKVQQLDELVAQSARDDADGSAPEHIAPQQTRDFEIAPDPTQLDPNPTGEPDPSLVDSMMITEPRLAIPPRSGSTLDMESGIQALPSGSTLDLGPSAPPLPSGSTLDLGPKVKPIADVADSHPPRGGGARSTLDLGPAGVGITEPFPALPSRSRDQGAGLAGAGRSTVDLHAPLPTSGEPNSSPRLFAPAPDTEIRSYSQLIATTDEPAETPVLDDSIDAPFQMPEPLAEDSDNALDAPGDSSPGSAMVEESAPHAETSAPHVQAEGIVAAAGTGESGNQAYGPPSGDSPNLAIGPDPATTGRPTVDINPPAVSPQPAATESAAGVDDSSDEDITQIMKHRQRKSSQWLPLLLGLAAFAIALTGGYVFLLRSVQNPSSNSSSNTPTGAPEGTPTTVSTTAGNPSEAAEAANSPEAGSANEVPTPDPKPIATADGNETAEVPAMHPDTGEPPAAIELVTITVRSSPNGAEVKLLDGSEQAGITPGAFKIPKTGTVQARITHAGYVSQEITLDPAQRRPARIRLEPMPWIIRLNSQPEGAVVYVEGRRVDGVTPNEMQLPSTLVGKRRFKVGFRKPGYKKLNVFLEDQSFEAMGESLVATVEGILRDEESSPPVRRPRRAQKPAARDNSTTRPTTPPTTRASAGDSAGDPASATAPPPVSKDNGVGDGAGGTGNDTSKATGNQNAGGTNDRPGAANRDDSAAATDTRAVGTGDSTPKTDDSDSSGGKANTPKQPPAENGAGVSDSPNPEVQKREAQSNPPAAPAEQNSAAQADPAGPKG